MDHVLCVWVVTVRFAGRVAFQNCTWPLEPKAYTSLARHIPQTYTEWCLGEKTDYGAVQATQARQAAIVLGAKQHRVGDSKAPLSVSMTKASYVPAMYEYIYDSEGRRA